jgi:hypothetical protein
VVEVGFGAMHARIDEWEVADLLDRAAHGRTYDDVRRSFADQLAQALATKLRAQAAEHDRSLFSGDVAAFTEHAVRKLRKAGVPSAILPQVSASMVLNKLLEEPDFLTMVAGQVLTASERAALHPTDAAISKGRRRDRSLADLALLDEIASVLGAEVERFDHVIVDEAQDLSPMQWRSIKRRTRAGGLTILGDLAQATGVWSPASWQQLLDHLGFGATGQVGELRLGYRVPRPILDFASQLLPVAAPKVPQPVSYRNGRSPGRHRVSLPEVWDTVRAAVDGTDGRIAVIAPANADVPMTMAPSGGASPLVLTPEESKGLEFDHVVVIEPAEIASTGRRGLRQLYVALTRSTKRLDIVHTQDLPALLRGEAPDQLSRTDPTDDWSIDPSVGAWAAVADLRGIPLVDARALAPTDDLRALEASAATPVANWYGDATGRFAFRYWDGEQWTGWVAATSGAVAADPAPVRHDQGPSGNPAEVAVVGLPIPPPAN